MLMTIVPTRLFKRIDGRDFRLWKGVTSKGVRCVLYVYPQSQGNDVQDAADFERESEAIIPPEGAQRGK